MTSRKLCSHLMAIKSAHKVLGSGAVCLHLCVPPRLPYRIPPRYAGYLVFDLSFMRMVRLLALPRVLSLRLSLWTRQVFCGCPFYAFAVIVLPSRLKMGLWTVTQLSHFWPNQNPVSLLMTLLLWMTVPRRSRKCLMATKDC